MSTLVSSTNRRRSPRAFAFSSPAAAEAGPGSERLRRFKHFLRVAGDLHLAPFVPQNTGAVQQESAALDPEVLPAVQTLFVDDIECLAELFVLIGEQRKRQLLLVSEAIVGADAVARDAHHHGACLAECSVQIAKVLALPGAAGGHVLRIEVEHQLPAGRVLQSPRSAATGGEGEILDSRADLRRGHLGGSLRLQAARGLKPHGASIHYDFTGSRMASRLSESDRKSVV